MLQLKKLRHNPDLTFSNSTTKVKAVGLMFQKRIMDIAGGVEFSHSIYFKVSPLTPLESLLSVGHYNDEMSCPIPKSRNEMYNDEMYCSVSWQCPVLYQPSRVCCVLHSFFVLLQNATIIYALAYFLVYRELPAWANEQMGIAKGSPSRLPMTSNSVTYTCCMITEVVSQDS